MTKRILWLLLWVLILSGCVPSETEIPVETETPEVIETPVETIIDDTDTIDYYNTYSIVDKATEYVFPNQNLKLYDDSRYPGVLYVDVEELMAILSPGLLSFEIETTDVLVITVPLYGENDQLLHTFELKIDPTRNRLTYNDFNYSLAISGSGQTEYDSDLKLVSYEASEPKPLQIDLNPYGIDLLLSDGKFYMPLDLANLTLTGYSLSLYRFGGTIYVIDDFSNMSTILDDLILTAPLEQAEMVDYTNRFSALMFDYFYGLKSHYEVDSYLSEFDEKQFDASTTIASFSGKFQQFIYDNDDLHTQIIDYGYGRTQVSSMISPLPYSKTVEYIREYLNRCLFIGQDQPIILYDLPEAYVLQIHEFNLETKDVLARVLTNIDSSKDIYIDLTCNGGGAIIAVIELLTYMTNQPIELNYTNATTGVIYKETYQSKVSRALDNQFIVLTSKVTYSAANLFVSIVKDMDLALVIGRPTSGGAAAVSYAVLPNNLIMTYSTPMIFIGEDDEIIESGIEPDYQLDNYMQASQMIDYILHIFNYQSPFDLDDDSDLSSISLDYVTTFIPTGMDVEGFTIEYIDTLAENVIQTYETNDLNFTIEEDIPGLKKLVEVRITVHFTLFGQSFSEVFYQNYIDELGESMNQEAFLLNLSETYQTTKHSDTDIDIIKIVVTEPDVYRILVNGTYGSGFSNEVYKSTGQRISGGWTVTLEPGTYYIKINLREVNFHYTIRINRMYDDNIGGTPIEIDETLQSVTLTYDFADDTEWVIITVPEEMKVAMHTNQYIGSSFYINNLDGTRYHPNSNYLNLSATPMIVILAQGTYLLKFHYDMAGTATIFFQGFPLQGDYSGDVSLEDDRFGVLQTGINSFLFEARWDRDIYTIEATMMTDVIFKGTNLIDVCLIEGDALTCLYQEQYFTLFPGTHHFVFTYKGTDAPRTLELEMSVLMDQSTEDYPIPIVIGEQFEVIIEKDGDIDYYTLSVTELTIFKLSMINGHTSYVSIHDALGTKLYGSSYGHMYFQLEPGEYDVLITEYVYNLSTVETYLVTIEIVNIIDLDPNLRSFDPVYYREFTNGASLSNQVQGSIDYDNDTDYFIIKITVSGVYQFSGSQSDIMYYYLYDANGDRERLRNNWTYVLEPGIYYLSASSSYTYITQPILYTWALFKKS